MIDGSQKYACESFREIGVPNRLYRHGSGRLCNETGAQPVTPPEI
jgi:hypothetical protein